MGSVDEARHFRRYTKSLGFILKFKEWPIRAETFNYSLQGMGVLVKGRPPIKEGDILHIGQIELGNVGDASVAWTKPDDDAMVVGVSLIRPIEGCFSYFRFPDIVSGFRKGRKTGTFALIEPAGRKIYVKNGELIFATSEKHEDSLDRFLLRKGWLNKEQYYQAVEQQMLTGKSQGAVLVGLGYLKPAELVEAVKMQVEDIIKSILSDDEGYFRFEENALPEGDLITMKLPAANLIYRGLKESRSGRVLEQYCPRMTDVIRFTASHEEFWAISPDGEDWRILALVDGRKRLCDILKNSPFDEYTTLRSICALRGAGVIEAGDNEVIPGEAPDAGLSEETEDVLAKEKALMRFREGRKLLTWGHVEAAEGLFVQAISLDSSVSKYHHHRGIALRRLGRNIEAEHCFSTALKLDPLNPDIIDELNRLYGRMR